MSGSATETDDFPVTVQLYYDYGTPGQLDGADVFVTQQTDMLIADPAKSFTVSQTQPVLLVYKTQRGCFDKIIALANSCLPLPVNFKSFSAERTGSNVLLKWETITEDNSTGFAIDRNSGNGWTEIGFVNTQAAGGYSNSILSYNYTDINNSRGITQYRLRQMDRDFRPRFSAIRSVRGENQKGNTMSFDGKINVFFEDVTGTRDLILTDMNGRILKKWSGFTDNSLKIDNLVPGMYSLRIVLRETGEQTVQKLVISKR
ncbi:MAG: T9SS type A sorting domain-containing protein [Chitinophagaceae bacterium]|nr:T9SS type A sorting domain-containing protein [Chitinophagaceae bacterium]